MLQEKKQKVITLKESLKNIKESIQAKQQAIQETQTTQMKEVSHLTTKIEILQTQLNDSKRKLKLNSQNSQNQVLANNLFKSFK